MITACKHATTSEEGVRRRWFFAGFLLSHHHFLRLFSALISLQDNDVDEIGSPGW
jgi:hypothetical protein